MDHALIEARQLISALQRSLDVAHDRIRDNEKAIAEMNARLAEQTEARDAADIRLATMEQARCAAQMDADATPAFPGRVTLA